MTDCTASLFAYQLPIQSGLILKNQRLTQREGYLLQLRQGTRIGWGEIAPLPAFSRETLAQAYEAILAWIKAPRYPQTGVPSVDFGISCALAELSGELTRFTQKPASATLYHGDLNAFLHALSHNPHRLAKVKICRTDPKSEGKLVADLLAADPTLHLRLDANQGWALDEALVFADAIPLALRTRIDFIEEPCRHWQMSLAFSERAQIAIAADESLRTPNFDWQPQPFWRAIVIKPSLTGSLRQCASLQQRAADLGLDCVISSSLESSLGLSQLAQLSRLWHAHPVAGLDTLSIMSHQLIRPFGDSALPILPERALNRLVTLPLSLNFLEKRA